MLYLLLKQGKISTSNEEQLRMLDPFVELLTDCLESKHNKVRYFFLTHATKANIYYFFLKPIFRLMPNPHTEYYCLSAEVNRAE